MQDSPPRHFRSLVLLAVPFGLVLASCVMVPTGADYYGADYGYGSTAPAWQGERWEQEEAHRREMVRRQQEYRRKMAGREREERRRGEDWRREEYRPEPRYEIEPRREESWEDSPPELDPQRRLDPPDGVPNETPRLEVPRGEQSEHPSGVPVPGKEGMVYNPIGKQGQMIDVRGIPSGTLVKDPYTDTLFRVP